MNNIMGPIVSLHTRGMAIRCLKHLTARVKSNVQVKLEITEGKVCEMKQAGLKLCGGVPGIE